GTKRNFVRARQWTLQVLGRRRCVDANHGARTSGRRVGTSGSCRCAGKSWTTRVFDRGSEGEKRRTVPVRRRGSDVEKSDGGQAERRTLVQERGCRGTEE